MGCDFPIKCKFWDSREKKCKLSSEEFQELCNRETNPCEMYQEKIDAIAEQEFIEAYHKGDYEAMKVILLSPFTNFGKKEISQNEE